MLLLVLLKVLICHVYETMAYVVYVTFILCPPGVFTLSEDNIMTQRIAVFPADRHSLYEEHGYSAAIRSGDLLFVSGQVGSHTDGTPEPDFQKQVRLAFENLKATLTAAGCTFDDIVDVTTFHTDPEQQLNDVMAVKQEIFAHPPILTGPLLALPGWPALISK